MVTKQDALEQNEFHYGDCAKARHPEKWRRNSATKVWKRNASRFRIALKYGLYQYGVLDETNAALFHLPADCPLKGAK